MSLLLVNSRDVGNKFLFGHWMMRNKGGQLGFTGPGYGRILYWPRSTDLADVEKDMVEMRKNGLRGYAIQLTGPCQMKDGCWACCGSDNISPIFSRDDAPTGSITWPTNPYGHYFGRDGTDKWYDEVREEYKKLIKLSRKYNMWLLVFVVGFRMFDPEPYEIGGAVTNISRWTGWINEFPGSSPDPGSSPAAGDGEHDSLSRRKELRMAIESKKHYIFGFNGNGNDPKWGPTEEEMHKLVTDVLLKCGGQERVLVCPIDEIPDRRETELKNFEEWCVKTVKSKGFATAVYSENNNKKNARLCQGGHQNNVSAAICEKGIGISDNDEMLIKELYPDEHPAEPGSEAWAEYAYSIYEIAGNKKVDVNKVKTLISKYKKSNARAGMLYAINYGKGNGNIDADAPGIKAIGESWRNPT